MKLFRFMKISPGSLPNQGIFPAKVIMIPSTVMIIPVMITDLPNPVIIPRSLPDLRMIPLFLAIDAATVLLAVELHFL